MKRDSILKDDIFPKFGDICKKYSMNHSEDNLNKLLDLYQEMIPNWVRDYNNLSQRLQERHNNNRSDTGNLLNIQLPKGYSVKDLKAPKNESGDITTDVMQRGRIIHLVNKVAHQFEYVFDTRLRNYMVNHRIIPDSKEESRQIRYLVKTMYSNNKDKVKDRAKRRLCTEYGFREADFSDTNLNSLGLSSLLNAYNEAMHIKNIEMANVNRLVQKYNLENISYGIAKDTAYKDIFVMDITGYGQFSVHIKDQNLASKIRREYKMPVYTKETQMLVDYMPSKTKQFINDARTDDSMDEDRDIQENMSETQKERARLLEEIQFLDITAAEKHELAVKGEVGRENLEKLNRTDEER